MDAASYLKRHGWRGDGHSLDHTGRGIRKPLLVSKKVDVLGVGLNKHAAVSDQWWMRAFDQGLKDLGSGKRTALADVREKGMAYGGLYGRFVKGEGVAGTFDESKSEGKESRKRKRGGQDEGDKSEKKAKTDTKSLQRSLRRDLRGFVEEAIRRGLISRDPDTASTKNTPGSKVVQKYGEDVVKKVFVRAGLDEESKITAKGNNDKYSRGKQQRIVERAAKKHLISLMSPAEREALGEEIAGRKVAKQPKETEPADSKGTAEESKLLKRQEKRAKKSAERADSGNGAVAANDVAIKNKSKKVVGADGALRYATKAEKGAKKQKAQAQEGHISSDSSNCERIVLETKDAAFVVDTVGNDDLEEKASLRNPLDVVDSDGNIRYTCKPDEPVPLDPIIWTGIKPKHLPAPVRKARTEHMRQKREARQTRKADAERAKPIPKGKIEKTSRGREKKSHKGSK